MREASAPDPASNTFALRRGFGAGVGGRRGDGASNRGFFRRAGRAVGGAPLVTCAGGERHEGNGREAWED